MRLHRRSVLYGMATLPATALPPATVPDAALPPATVPDAALPAPTGKVRDCRGLRAALRDAGPGDVIHLEPGDYLDDGLGRLVLSASHVALRAAGPARPLLRVADAQHRPTRRIRRASAPQMCRRADCAPRPALRP